MFTERAGPVLSKLIDFNSNVQHGPAKFLFAVISQLVYEERPIKCDLRNQAFIWTFAACILLFDAAKSCPLSLWNVTGLMKKAVWIGTEISLSTWSKPVVCQLCSPGCWDLVHLCTKDWTVQVTGSNPGNPRHSGPWKSHVCSGPSGYMSFKAKMNGAILIWCTGGELRLEWDFHRKHWNAFQCLWRLPVVEVIIVLNILGKNSSIY